MNRDGSRDNRFDQLELLKALEDVSCAFSRDDLTAIINDQFFNDATPLDADLMDAIIARMLLLNGATLDEVSFQRERKQVITSILKKILISEK